MEKMLSVEEKIRRAEEIYERRKKNSTRPVATVNVGEKKDIKLLKKLIMQLLVCVCIYLIVYSIQNNNYIFSEDFRKKANEILSYNTNFEEIYLKMTNAINHIVNKNENEELEEQKDNNEQTQNQEMVGGIGGQEQTNEAEEQSASVQDTQNMTQTELDVLMAKNTTTYIKPIDGVISSKYGLREQATGRVPKNHTGTDIAANLGTKIKSATDGEVVLSSEEGDYRKTFKNTNR